MLLLPSLYAGMPDVGVAGVMTMSIVLEVVISFAGYLAYAGRVGIFLQLKEKEKFLSMLSAFLEMVLF